MSIESCIPVIPSADIEKSMRLWVDGLGFSPSSEMHKNGALTFCMLERGNLRFILNRRAGNPIKPPQYEGIRLYWAPTDINETRARLQNLGYCVPNSHIETMAKPNLY